MDKMRQIREEKYFNWTVKLNGEFVEFEYFIPRNVGCRVKILIEKRENRQNLRNFSHEQSWRMW